MKTPQTLNHDGKQFWKAVTDEIKIVEPHDIEMLHRACQCLDRIKEAQDAIKKDGPYLEVKGGGIRPHPALKVEKEFMTLFYRAIRDLDLDPPPEKIPSRRGRSF